MSAPKKDVEPEVDIAEDDEEQSLPDATEAEVGDGGEQEDGRGDDLLIAGMDCRQARAMDFDQTARLECLAGSVNVQGRHRSANPSASHHQAFQRQPRQGLANAGQPAAIAPRQRILIQLLAGGERPRPLREGEDVEPTPIGQPA